MLQRVKDIQRWKRALAKFFFITVILSAGNYLYLVVTKQAVAQDDFYSSIFAAFVFSSMELFFSKEKSNTTTYPEEAEELRTFSIKNYLLLFVFIFALFLLAGTILTGAIFLLFTAMEKETDLSFGQTWLGLLAFVTGFSFLFLVFQVAKDRWRLRRFDKQNVNE